MRVIVDRIEDGIATVELENGKIINVPAQLFVGCHDGDIVYITVDKEETKREKQRLLDELNSL